MINLTFSPKADSLKILCLGAHCDDIEIGCGGTVLKLLTAHRRADVHWVVFSSNEMRKREAEQSARAFLRRAPVKSVIIQAYRDGYFPFEGGEIKDYFEKLKREADPDLIFTHHRSDMHQDHRLVSELTWNTFRDQMILEYEIPKYDGDLGAPNVFVHLDEPLCRTKISYILKYFRSQADHAWFAEETFRAIMRLRGLESNSSSRYAEAFHSRKLLIR